MWGGIPSQSCGKTHGHTPSVDVNTRVLSCKSPRQDAKSAEDECPSGPLGKHQPRPAQVGSRFDALRGPKVRVVVPVPVRLRGVPAGKLGSGPSGPLGGAFALHLPLCHHQGLLAMAG